MASEHFGLEKGGAAETARFAPRLRGNGLRRLCQNVFLFGWGGVLAPRQMENGLFCKLADRGLRLGPGAARAPFGRRRVSAKTRFPLCACGEMASEHFGQR